MNYTHDSVRELAKHYTSRKKFDKENRGAWNYTRKHGLLDELFGPTTRNRYDTSKPGMMLPKDTGIYILYQGSTIVYIGKSNTSMTMRVNSHKGLGLKEFDKVEFYHVDNQSDIVVAELYLINKHKPIYNLDSKMSDELTLCISNLDDIVLKVTTQLVQ